MSRVPHDLLMNHILRTMARQCHLDSNQPENQSGPEGLWGLALLLIVIIFGIYIVFNI